MNREQRDRLLSDFSGPPYDPELDRDELLHELFEAAVDAGPERTAIGLGDQTWTYREIDAEANRLAHALRERGVGPDDKVAIQLEKTEFLYVAMLGVLKAGGAYVPLDPGYPGDRVAYILSDCQAKLLITQTSIADALGPELTEAGTPLFLADRERAALKTRPETRIPRGETGQTRENLAYIIYTSGTTGRPKGCLIEHRQICNLVRSEASVYGIGPDDRVFQCASPAFDASLEEIWMAFFHGAVLLPATKEIMRSGPQMAGLMTDLGVTMLSCVPTLLSMIEGDIATLRVLIVGGEACPRDLAARWHRPGRVIFNSYGPTEATVAATYAILEPNGPVTIGRPLPNYRAYILDEQLELVEPGAEGELFIGGEGVARGYLGRDDLTRERFVVTERPGGGPMRLYRTGDQAKFTDAGDIEYLGRADAQVKLRGFRIELTEIESVLMQCPGVLGAAVALNPALQALAAYVVPRAGQTINRGILRETLVSRLPPYMMPATLDECAALPMLTSGKVDRKALPTPETPFIDESREVVAPRTETETRLAAVWADVFGRREVSVTDDFFMDLGGHSLLAAAMASKLRGMPGLDQASIGDVYQHPTIEGLAAAMDQRAKAQSTAKATTHAAYQPPSATSYLLCSLGQAAGLFILAGIYAWQWLGPFFTSAYLVLDGWTLLQSVLPALVVYSVSLPVLLLTVVIVKWLLLGRMKPGHHPLWGWYYLRFWFVRQLTRAVAIKYLAGTPLLCLMYRMLGARIGRDVFLGGAGLATPDLLVVGDGSSVGFDTSIDGSWVEDGMLHLAPITVGKGCHVGNRSVLGGHTVMEDGSILGDLSYLAEGDRIPAGERYEGSPAVPVGPARNAPAKPMWSFGYGLLFTVGVFLYPLLVEGVVFPGMLVMERLDYIEPYYWWLLYAPVVALSIVLGICAEVALFKWLLMPRVHEGVFPIRSWFYYRKWFVGQLMQMSLEVLGTLYSTLYLKPWFRLLGAHIGKDSEISTVRHVEPEMLVAGDACFLADDAMIGAPRVQNGTIAVGYVHVGDKTFVGNSAVVPSGMVLGDGVLVGCLSTTPSANPIQNGTSWFGSPALLLPRRQQAEHFAESRTYAPPRRLIALRYVIEFFRVTLPCTLFVACATMLMNIIDMVQETTPLWFQVSLLPLLYIGFGFLGFAVVALIKWLLVGRYKASNHPLWCDFVWRTELVTGLYENFGVYFLLDILRGTPFISWPLRLLGMHIGRRCYIDTSWYTEFDLIHIDDEAALNEDANLQTHLFEDRVMKVDGVKIGKRCTVGMKATILYHTELEDDVCLGDLSLIMKGETLPKGTRWQGAPARHLD
ncbi:MAG: Pls/PosA family non-ribosomal peptide synthetase [Solidesulfovibrio sp.]